MSRTIVPIHIDSGDGTLFAWAHPPSSGALHARAGVVLCNPIGDDLIRAHRTFRHLAERFARAGFAVLRFDFHGTGDSSGDERDPQRVERWIADVGVAVAALRARSGCDRIWLVGLKLGATVAAAWAARHGGIEGMVLWAPHATGAAFLTETTRLHRMHRMLEPEGFAIEPPGWDAGGEQALGFLLTPSTMDELGRLDLFAESPPRDGRVLVIGAANVPGDERLVAHLGAHGAKVEYRHMPGHKFLISIPHHSTVPEPVLETIVSYVGAQPAAAPATAAAGGVAAALVSSDGAATDEKPLFFGPNRALFGLLAAPPPRRARRGRPAIVLLNAGTVHRIGPHRMYVPLARRWAEQGYYVFRVDISGIGDSRGSPENLCYPASAIADVQAAMSAIADKAERFVLVGLCSGADLAFQVGARDPRVAGAVMMNPRTFCIHDLAMVESAKRAGYYVDSFLDRRKLRRLLIGDVDITRALGMLAVNARTVVQNRLSSLLTRRRAGAPNDVPACLTAMTARGVEVLLLVALHDPGVEYVDLHFGARMRALEGQPRFRRVDLRGTDHTFTSLYAQRLVAELVTEHITRSHS
jgi:dienelactone hydrolase